MLDDAALAQAAALLDALRARGLNIATAESCTGGLVAAALTAIPGSSDCVLAGFVTYANAAKVRMLGVPEEILARDGAVSEACARHMAEGAVRAAGSDVAVATTGVAGPGGGSAEKPVGLVFIAVARPGKPTVVERLMLQGGRNAIRAETVRAVFSLVAKLVAASAASSPHITLS